MRSGDVLLEELRKLQPDVPIGKMLIQRNDKQKQFKKLPKDISDRFIILVDPILATGQSAILALEELIHKSGVKEENVMFLCLMCAPEGLERIQNNYPKVQITTASIDEKLSEKKFIVPGLGDFGDRFYGT